MIKFSRLDTDKARAAVASLQKAKAAKESYNTPDAISVKIKMESPLFRSST